ncbi:PA14 domain-containing protein [Virgibacillus kekensis]|uniref:PA14 domain-containing protein n=1 Tax=Virgibacillus kekensis TaxID=202261 RepID=A0ABV9DHW1_9BACI
MFYSMYIFRGWFNIVKKGISRFFRIVCFLCFFMILIPIGALNAQSYDYTEKAKSVHYNWGYGSPSSKIKNNNFSVEIDQTQSLNSGDYFIQTFADDRVRVRYNSEYLINRWSNSPGILNKAVLPDLQAGTHKISTEFYEARGAATLYSDVVPFNTWLAYYYSNENLKGHPVAAKRIPSKGEWSQFEENNGLESPIPGKVSKNYFSARYVTAKRVPAGDYILRVRADDGARILVDGEVVFERWSSSGYKEDAVKVNIKDNLNAEPNEANIHWIEVQYFDRSSASRVSFSMQPYDSAITEKEWVAGFYNNENLNGTPYVIGGTGTINHLRNLDLDWHRGSPNGLIPNDYFSMRAEKQISIPQYGYYKIKARADDGVRVYLDNKLVIDSWEGSDGGLREVNVPLTKGVHNVRVEYFERRGAASIEFDIVPNSVTLFQKDVQVNWGYGGPGAGLSNDDFNVIFNQSQQLNSKDHYIQTFADDRVRVKVNGKHVIDRWSDSPGIIDRALLTNVNNEVQDIVTEFQETRGAATLYSHVVPFNTWLAYYYPNQELLGHPIASKQLPSQGEGSKFEENNRRGSPVPGTVNTDDFSARYVTAKHITEGEYIVRARSDDGIRVLIDGEVVVDRWTPSGYQENAVKVKITDNEEAPAGEKDVHWIEVQYFERSSASRVAFSMQPAETVFNQDEWVGEVYKNTTFSGEPVIIGGKGALNPIDNLNLNWGAGSPNELVPTNEFSARFTKNVHMDRSGDYVLEASADDSMRVWIDGKLLVDSWTSNISKVVNLSEGIHKIKVEYKEVEGNASINFNLEPRYAKFNQDSFHYNWGYSGPGNGHPTDGFSALVNQTQVLNQKDYFIQTFADDRVRVKVDGNYAINRWTDSSGIIDRALLTGMTSKEHQIQTEYYETRGSATLFTDIVPFNTWLAYYYPNQDLSGHPVAAKRLESQRPWNQFNEDSGLGSPVEGKVPSDGFSSRYVTASRIPAGEYLIRNAADDGVRVYIDGKLVLDRWSTSTYKENNTKIQIKDRPEAATGKKDVHWIEVQYFERSGASKVSFSLQPYNTVIGEESWLAEYYPNNNLSGEPIIVGGVGSVDPIPNLNFDWDQSSPHEKIPVDNFSATFTKKLYVPQQKDYEFSVKSDDGIRIYVDGKKILGAWYGSNNGYKRIVNLTKGTHTIKVEYNEGIGRAHIDFGIDIPVKKEVNYIPYDLTLEQMTDIQMRVSPQTDKRYPLWIREDGLLENQPSNGKGTVQGDNWNLRRGPGTQYIAGGQVDNGEVYPLYKSTKASDGYIWHHIKYTSGWVVADREDVRYNLNPNNFTDTFKDSLQFLKLSHSANLDVQEVNNKILNGKGILDGKAQAFSEAGNKHGVNEIYLISHALLETGNGTSSLATGIVVDGSKGKRTVYNMYGIGAKDSCPLECGAQYAYDAGWFTPESAIIGGAQFIGEGYVNNGQDTLYKMRWNPEAAAKYGYATHQYATDIGWAWKQTSTMNNIFSLLESYSISFEIPQYKK